MTDGTGSGNGPGHGAPGTGQANHHRPSDTGELLTVAELAKLWKVSPLTIRRLIADKSLPVVYVGPRMQRVPRRSAMDYLARNAPGQGQGA